MTGQGSDRLPRKDFRPLERAADAVLLAGDHLAAGGTRTAAATAVLAIYADAADEIAGNAGAIVASAVARPNRHALKAATLTAEVLSEAWVQMVSGALILAGEAVLQLAARSGRNHADVVRELLERLSS